MEATVAVSAKLGNATKQYLPLIRNFTPRVSWLLT
jgi:hypothetical protein